MDTIKRIVGLISPYKRKIILGLMLQLVVILTRLITPYVTKTVVNDVITQMNMDLLLPLCGALLGLTLLRGICTECDLGSAHGALCTSGRIAPSILR